MTPALDASEVLFCAAVAPLRDGGFASRPVFAIDGPGLKLQVLQPHVAGSYDVLAMRVADRVLVGFSMVPVLRDLREQRIEPRQGVVDLAVEVGALLNNGKGNDALVMDLPQALSHSGVRDNVGALLSLRRRVGRGLTASEQKLLATLEVRAVGYLFEVWRPRIDRRVALLRGSYLGATASMERLGIPVDDDALVRFEASRPALVSAIRARPDAGVRTLLSNHGVSLVGLAPYVVGGGLTDEWPRTATGLLSTSAESVRSMAARDGRLVDIAIAANQLNHINGRALQAGVDGRLRTALRPFTSRTGRNQPSSAGYIFGRPRWMRGFIRPGEGRALVYVDWSAQEFGVAAGLSGDPNMIASYESGEPYLSSAIRAHAAPAGATRESHGAIREVFKEVALGTLYGMGAQKLAEKVSVSLPRAEELLRLHRKAHPAFWEWSRSYIDQAELRGRVSSVFGWPLQVTAETKHTTLMNFPVQSNAAEMLRIAIIHAVDDGIDVVAPVHDAILVESSVDEVDSVAARVRAHMQRASRTVLQTLELRTDATLIRWPERWPGAAHDPLWCLAAEIGGWRP